MDDPSWPEEYFSHSHGEAKASYPRWTKAESELTCHIQACADLSSDHLCGVIPQMHQFLYRSQT